MEPPPQQQLQSHHQTIPSSQNQTPHGCPLSPKRGNWSDPDGPMTFHSGRKWALCKPPSPLMHPLTDTSLALHQCLPLPPTTGPLTWGSAADFRTLMWAVSGGCAGVPDAWYPFTAGTETWLRCGAGHRLPAPAAPSPASGPGAGRARLKTSPVFTELEKGREPLSNPQHPMTELVGEPVSF